VLATLRGLELEALARPSERPDRAALVRAFQALIEGLIARESPRGAGAKPRGRTR
jgi:hypothetical protein